MHIPRIGKYLKTLVLKEIKNFIYGIFGKYLRCTKKETYSKLNKEKI